MKHLKLLALVSMVLVVSAPAFAAGGKKKSQPAPLAQQPDSSPTYSSSSSTPQGIQWNVMGPLQLVGGTAMFGANVSGDYFIRNDISVGGESGFMIGSSNSVTFWEIPFVVTGKYHFSMAQMPNWRPYVGAGMGLSIFHGGVGSITIGGVTVPGGSSTQGDFRGELKVGTAFQSGPGWLAEIKLGIINSSFLFAPSVGWQF
jgi:hypothetical protein